MALFTGFPYYQIGEEIVSPLSREECRARLADAIDGPMTVFGSKPVIGRVSVSGFRLRKRISGRNSFQTYLVGQFIEEFGSTKIVCKTGPSLFSICFMAFWFGILLTIIAPVWGKILRDADYDLHTLTTMDPTAFIPLGMIAFGIGLVCICRYLARGEGAFLIDFVKATLDARQI